MFHLQEFLEAMSRVLADGDEIVRAHEFFQVVKEHTDTSGSIADVMNTWLNVQSPPFLKHLLRFCCHVVLFQYLKRIGAPADHQCNVREKMTKSKIDTIFLLLITIDY